MNFNDKIEKSGLDKEIDSLKKAELMSAYSNEEDIVNEVNLLEIG